MVFPAPSLLETPRKSGESAQTASVQAAREEPQSPSSESHHRPLPFPQKFPNKPHPGSNALHTIHKHLFHALRRKDRRLIWPKAYSSASPSTKPPNPGARARTVCEIARRACVPSTAFEETHLPIREPNVDLAGNRQPAGCDASFPESRVLLRSLARSSQVRSFSYPIFCS